MGRFHRHVHDDLARPLSRRPELLVVPPAWACCASRRDITCLARRQPSTGGGETSDAADGSASGCALLVAVTGARSLPCTEMSGTPTPVVGVGYGAMATAVIGVCTHPACWVGGLAAGNYMADRWQVARKRCGGLGGMFGGRAKRRRDGSKRGCAVTFR